MWRVAPKFYIKLYDQTGLSLLTHLLAFKASPLGHHLFILASTKNLQSMLIMIMTEWERNVILDRILRGALTSNCTPVDNSTPMGLRCWKH